MRVWLNGFAGGRTLASPTRLGRIFVAGCAAVALAGLAVAAVPRSSQAPTETLAEPDRSATDRWIDVPRPIEAFALSVPGLPVHATYRGERNPGTDGRRDTILLGSLAEDGPFVAVSVVRRTSEDGRELGDTSLRLTGGTASGAGDPTPMRTKFGPMFAAELSAGPAGRRRSCLAFGRHEEAMRVAIQGIACAPPGSSIDRKTAACLVDRLDLIGGDPVMRAYFVAAEKQRKFCGASDLRAAGTMRRALPR